MEIHFTCLVNDITFYLSVKGDEEEEADLVALFSHYSSFSHPQSRAYAIVSSPSEAFQPTSGSRLYTYRMSVNEVGLGRMMILVLVCCRIVRTQLYLPFYCTAVA